MTNFHLQWSILTYLHLRSHKIIVIIIILNQLRIVKAQKFRILYCDKRKIFASLLRTGVRTIIYYSLWIFLLKESKKEFKGLQLSVFEVKNVGISVWERFQAWNIHANEMVTIMTSSQCFAKAMIKRQSNYLQN